MTQPRGSLTAARWTMSQGSDGSLQLDPDPDSGPESADGLVSSSDGYISDSASSLGGTDHDSGAEDAKDGSADADVIEFAKYLGMDPVADRDLLWIAQEALKAPLPSEWTEHEDSDGNQYFFNSQTNASAWEHPLDVHFRKLYAQRKKERAEGDSAGSGQDRFPAFVTFSVADPDDQMSPPHDPVGPRERVKQWVGAQQAGQPIHTKKLLRYTTSASDTVLGKHSSMADSVPGEEPGPFGKQSVASPELAPRTLGVSKRKGKRGSWQAGESGEAAAAQALAWQMEAMELSGGSRAADGVVCRQLAGDGGLQNGAAAADAAGNGGAAGAAGDAPTGLTLSDVFAFPGAAVMQQPQRVLKARNVEGASITMSKSWTAPSKAISKSTISKNTRRAAAMVVSQTTDHGAAAMVVSQSDHESSGAARRKRVDSLGGAPAAAVETVAPLRARESSEVMAESPRAGDEPELAGEV